MITLTSAQLDAWVAAFMFPLTRILGLLATAPVFNNAGLPRRIRLMIGLAITVIVAPSLPPPPAIAVGSWLGISILVQQLLIGALLGFTLRLAFSAIDVAGEMIGLQMGLSFAIFYDPQNAAQTPVLSEFLGLIALLTYMAMNGHLLSLSALIETFQLLPISLTPFSAIGFKTAVAWAAAVFSSGVLLALPMIAALLIANIGMGVLSRVAPQLNLFAIGFPVTMIAGFTVLAISLPYLGTAMQRLFEDSFAAMHNVIRAAAG